MAKLHARDKPLFNPAAAANLRMVLAAALSVALMIADHRSQYLDAARGWLTTLAYPLQLAVQLPATLSGAVSDSLTSRRELHEQIEQLRRERLFLDAQLQKLTALETENRRLRLLLESSARLPERVLIAELLQVDPDPYRHRILLDKGWRHGVQVGQPLLTQDGIVGQVARVSPLTASAILITDSTHALPVQIERTGQRSLARGGGNYQELALLHLPNDDDVRVGDSVTSSGLGGRFPPGYPVATVSRVEFDPGQPFARIVLTPTAQLDRIREVLVVVGGGATARNPNAGGPDAGGPDAGGPDATHSEPTAP